MNRRLHLMMRIDDLKEHVDDPVVLHVFSDTNRVLEMDEDEITDLISRVNFLEEQVQSYPLPPLPEYDPDDERDDDDRADKDGE
jgi:NADPH-dependent glutamate synthase beta subunit-like oxidoreductase